MFLRLHAVGVLRRCCCPSASKAVKRRVSGLCTSGFPRAPPSALSTCRSLSTSCLLKKDAPRTKDASLEERPELDLDAWKSVMRSQALQEERANDDDDDGDEESTAEEEGDLSPLEASRRLLEMWRLAGKFVPETATDEQLETLSELATKSAKKKYLKYLAIKEGHKKTNRAKKEKKRAEKMAERKEEAEHDDGEEQGQPKLKNSYLMHFRSHSLDYLLGWRVAQAMQYGQPLVYDMSYEQHMSRKELENTISQLLETEGWNRRAAEPFHLHFCNLQPQGAYHRELLKRYGQETWERLLITATSQQHIDTFPQENLVYLTADSPNVLRTFDHSKVYVVGAMVDRSIQSGVSLANAKRFKLATARLPLDEYLHWDSGAKNLTLDQMIRILVTAKDTGSWEKALEFVPKRKHIGFYQHTSENYVQRTAAARTNHRESQAERAPLFGSKQRPRNQEFKKPVFGSAPNSGLSRLRIALKSKIEERSKAAKKKHWLEEE